jgi:hypothetical protein
MLTLPYRDATFQFLDDIPTRIERGAAMSVRAGYRDADVSDTKSPDSVFERNRHSGETVGGLGSNAVHFASAIVS